MVLLGFAVAQTDYTPYHVDTLAKRSYGGGSIQLVRELSRNNGFVRYQVRYPSDGLTMYGFMNVPTGKGPYPVVLVLHGYVNPSTYRTLTYTTRYADAITRMGYVVIHPNYQGHPPSQGNANGRYRVNYATEVVDLAAMVRSQAGKAGPLVKAKASIGLWGHSMGGGVSVRAAVLDPSIRAVVLYGSMSGDELQNARQIYEVFSGRTRGLFELNTPADQLVQISPINYLSRTRAAFSVHHGTADNQVPYAWSNQLCQKLKALGKSASCYSYRGGGHIFQGEYDTVFLSRVKAFFAKEL
jgi:dienelactone hydrolase